jgi:hypothetical protein
VADGLTLNHPNPKETIMTKPIETIRQPKPTKNVESTFKPAESCLTVLPKPSRTRYWTAPAAPRPAGDETPKLSQERKS